MQKEAAQVSEIINSNIISNRQHCLHFDIETTPSVISSCGIKVDSSLGFNRSIGFRAGTSYPYFLTQKDGIKLDLLELPMHIMDSSLFRADCLALDENLAKKKCLNLINHVERVGGCLTINFHPNYITNKSWWSTFEFLVKELKERDIFCLRPENIIGLVEH
jgi:hypothetical protein